MRTLVVTGIGVVLALLVSYAGHRLNASTFAPLLFVLAWGAFCIIDAWIGVAHAGYGLREEVMIHLVIFAIPVGIAVVASRSA